MPSDLMSLIILATVAAMVLWLVFFVARKLFGFALLVAIAVGAWMIWNDPTVLQKWFDAVMDVVNTYV
ncbi:UNVERIFIED_ORG: hypothetical protein J2W19_003155 [Shinella zoogloeoides]|nr:hypothetical protein [Shinella zoogloeoides]